MNSQSVWQEAYRWLYQQRKNAPADSDVWHLRFHWGIQAQSFPLRRATRLINEQMNAGGFMLHSDKTQLGCIKRGLNWLGLWFGTLSVRHLSRSLQIRADRIIRLYEWTRLVKVDQLKNMQVAATQIVFIFIIGLTTVTEARGGDTTISSSFVMSGTSENLPERSEFDIPHYRAIVYVRFNPAQSFVSKSEFCIGSGVSAKLYTNTYSSGDLSLTTDYQTYEASALTNTQIKADIYPLTGSPACGVFEPGRYSGTLGFIERTGWPGGIDPEFVHYDVELSGATCNYGVREISFGEVTPGNHKPGDIMATATPSSTSIECVQYSRPVEITYTTSSSTPDGLMILDPQRSGVGIRLRQSNGDVVLGTPIKIVNPETTDLTAELIRLPGEIIPGALSATAEVTYSYR